MISLDKVDRSRQKSVWVGGIEYLIHTGFFHWLAFEKKVLGKTITHEMLPEFDYLYVGGIPDDRAAGYNELLKFWRNEQPLPKDLGRENKTRTIDWHIDSERICEVFLRLYGIDLETQNIHWHKFLGLFYSYLCNLDKVIEARVYEKKDFKKTKEFKEYEEKTKLESKEMWSLESLEEKPLFKMR